MANPAAPYRIIGLRGQHIVEGKRRGSPAESWLCHWGKERRCDFVIRYFPSRKGWRVLDIREATCTSINMGRRVDVWRGQKRGQRYWPNADAAVMAALHGLA